MIITENKNIFVSSKSGCSDGIVIQKNYKLIYKLNEIDHYAEMKFKGMEILKGFSGLSHHVSDMVGKFDIEEIASYSRQFVVAWGTLSNSRNIRYEKYIIDSYGMDMFKLICDFLEGDVTYKNFIRDMIAGYIFVNKNRYGIQKYRENVLCLHDNHFEYMDEEVKKEVIDNWESHNITKRKGLTSKEEFVQILQKGSLNIEWSEKRFV